MSEHILREKRFKENKGGGGHRKWGPRFNRDKSVVDEHMVDERTTLVANSFLYSGLGNPLELFCDFVWTGLLWYQNSFFPLLLACVYVFFK